MTTQQKRQLKQVIREELENILSEESKPSKRSLNEEYVNVFTLNDKELYLDEVWDLINLSYSKIGGSSFRDKDDLLRDTWFWKLCIKNSKVVAGCIYKDKNGRKRICSFTNRTDVGRKELYRILSSDVKLSRAYAEVSGKMEDIMIGFNATPVPNKYVSGILKKDIELDPDGFHYTRLIGDNKHRKIMFTGEDFNFKNLDVDIIKKG